MYGRRWRDFNLFLIVGVIVLLGFGLMLVWSTTVGYQGHSYSMFIKHLIWLALGLVGLTVLTLFDYHNFRPLVKPMYIGAVVSLVLVTLIGKVRDGAQMEIFGIQPSEPTKLALIIALAVWWSSREENPEANGWVTLGGSLAIAGLPLVMVLVQPDFGTAMVMGCIWLAMAWGAGTRWMYLGTLFLAAVPVLYIGWFHVLKPYQQGRLVAFTMTADQVDSLTDPQVKKTVSDVFYQTEQSLIAIGNGNMLGRGLNQGIQSQRNFLPVQYTDFIFAVAGEELGFIGATALLIFECFVMWQGITIAGQARDTLGRLMATGVVGMLLIHTLENVGMNMKMLPMTGIPLPFISFGGSFTITTLCCMGLLEGIAIRRRSLVF